MGVIEGGAEDLRVDAGAVGFVALARVAVAVLAAGVGPRDCRDLVSLALCSKKYHLINDAYFKKFLADIQNISH